MKFNTPPRIPEIEEDSTEIIFIDNEAPPDDDLDELDDLQESIETENEPRIPSPIPDDAVVTFKMHKQAIFSADIHSSKGWAVTGSEDDTAYVWNIENGEIVYEVKGHKDTIISSVFNYDGNYLATGDMAGDIQVFKITETLTKVWEYSMGDMGWLFWHRAANILLAGSEECGEIYVWRIPSGDCKVLPGIGCKCETAELTHDGKKLLAGYRNGTVKLWDIKSMVAEMVIIPQNPISHIDAVTAVSCDHDSPLFMSGGEDGKIIFSSQNGPVGTVEATGTIEVVSFCPSSEIRVALSGTLDGQIAIWDYKQFSLRTACEHPEPHDGITKIKWISDTIFCVATVNGCIFGYDVRSGFRLFSLRGHEKSVYDLAYDRQRNLLLSVSEDFTAKVFKVPQLGD